MIDVQRAVAAILLAAVLARLAGNVAVRLYQPRVTGEIVFGLLAGPTLFGHETSSILFPENADVALHSLATLGLCLFSFDMGLAFDVRQLAPYKIQVATAATASFILPAVTAALLARMLPIDEDSGFRGSHASEPAFSLALASVFSASALPVVGLLLRDAEMVNTRNGQICIGAAALVSLLQCSLMGVAATAANDRSNWWMLVSFPGFFILGGALWVGSRLGLRHYRHYFLNQALAEDQPVVPTTRRNGPGPKYTEGPSTDVTLVIYAVAITAGIISEGLGYTYTLGSFVCGAAMPFHRVFRRGLSMPIRKPVFWVFLPVFFLVSGLGTNIREVGQSATSLFGVVLLVSGAIASKLAATIVAPLLKQSWRESMLQHALLNCRGTIVLVANLEGSALELFGPNTKAAIILLAALSTVMTTPLARALAARLQAEAREKQQTGSDTPDRSRRRKQHSPSLELQRPAYPGGETEDEAEPEVVSPPPFIISKLDLTQSV